MVSCNCVQAASNPYQTEEQSNETARECDALRLTAWNAREESGRKEVGETEGEQTSKCRLDSSG
jgi:hypothetical protein